MRHIVVAVLMAAGLSVTAQPGPVWAEDRALVITNTFYRSAGAVPGAEDMARSIATLEAAGFRVASGRDLTAEQMRNLLSRVVRSDSAGAQRQVPDRLVIILAGHFAHSARNGWLLATDARTPDLGTVGGAGIDLDTVLEIAGQASVQALVVLGEPARPMNVGPGLAAGSGTLDVPQGVTVVRGTAANAARALSGGLLDPGTVPARVLRSYPDLAAEGFLPPSLPFLPGRPLLPPQPVTPDPAIAAERAAWDAARQAGTIPALEQFLRDWPTGRNAPLARTELQRLRSDPVLIAQEAETALRLTRDARREVQSALTLLGYDTRGIDGIWGNGTREAIRGWQRQQGATVTGYMDAGQIALLRAQAERRAAQIEAEEQARQREAERADRAFWVSNGEGRTEAGLRAYLRRYPEGLFADIAQRRLSDIEAQRNQEQAAARERQVWERALALGTAAAFAAYLTDFPRGVFARDARNRMETLTEAEREQQAREAERADRAYWTSTGAGATEDGLRAYLRRYPDGRYAGEAQARLREIEEERQQQASSRDRRAWERAQSRDTVAAYTAYLSEFPRGSFAAEAQARIAALQPRPPEEDPAVNRARSAEIDLGLNDFTRRLVEDRLKAAGFDPGRVDGVFDEDAREAIRGYQAANGLLASGYVDDATVAVLLAGALGIGVQPGGGVGP